MEDEPAFSVDEDHGPLVGDNLAPVVQALVWSDEYGTVAIEPLIFFLSTIACLTFETPRHHS